MSTDKRDVRLEVLRDGEWQHLEYANSLTLKNDINRDRRVILDDRFDIPGPWRLYVDGEMIARKGYEWE